jgi:tetratricopeptide (TPR) repeat protein
MARKISSTASRPRSATAQRPANGSRSSVASKAAVTTRPRPPREEELAQNFFLGVALFFLATLIYYQAFHAGFIWDDDQLLTVNPQVHDPMGWWTLWTAPQTADYFPLTSSTLWLEWRLWGGPNPMGYHVMNVLFHATAVVLTWQVLKRLKVPGAWLAAALFAAHPVSVESVAWISERKNTVSQIFFLLSIIYYVRYEEKGTGWRYAAAVFCFFLALTAKTAVVMLPFILLILAWWRHRDLEPMRDNYELEKNPVERWLLLAGLPLGLALAAWSAVYFGWDLLIQQPKLITAAAALGPALSSFLFALVGGTFGAALARKLDKSCNRYPVEDWVLMGGVLAFAAAGCGIGAFLGSHVPGGMRMVAMAVLALAGGSAFGIAALYGLRALDKVRLNNLIGFEVIRTFPFFSVAFVLGVVTVYFQNGRAIGQEEIPIGNMLQRMASACFASGFYLYSALWPFNIIEIYPQWHRAFTTLMTMPTPHIAPKAPESIPYWQQVIPGVVIAGTLIYCWFRRTEVWARAILVGLGCYFVAMLPALGLMKMSYMRLTLVADHFQYISMVAVIALIVAAGYSGMVRPLWLFVASGFFAVVAYVNWNQTQDNHIYEIFWVIGPLVLACVPREGDTWRWAWGGFLGLVLVCAGIVSFWQTETYESEESLWSATLAKNPYTWQGNNHLGAALYSRGDIKDAFKYFLRATELKPENPESHNNLGLAYSYFASIDKDPQELEKAIEQYKIAVHIKDDPNMETNLGNAYESIKDFQDAISTYKHALELQPTNAAAHCNLGYAYLNLGEISGGINEFINAIEISPGMDQARTDLAESLREAGIDYNAPVVTGTYPFDAQTAVNLLKRFPPPSPQQGLGQ